MDIKAATRTTAMNLCLISVFCMALSWSCGFPRPTNVCTFSLPQRGRLLPRSRPAVGWSAGRAGGHRIATPIKMLGRRLCAMQRTLLVVQRDRAALRRVQAAVCEVGAGEEIAVPQCDRA